MRTSIDFSASILDEAKKVSRNEGVTLKVLAEEGLRLAIAKRRQSGHKKFRMITFGDPKDTSVDLSWDKIRDNVYPSES